MTLSRVAKFAGAAVAFALNGVKLALFLIGSSTVVEDARLLPGKAGALLVFIDRQPDLAFYSFFTVVMLVCLWSALRPSAKSQPETPASPGATISSHNQSGGVTAHTVNIGGNDVRK